MEPGRTARAGWIGRASAGTSVRFRLQVQVQDSCQTAKAARKTHTDCSMVGALAGRYTGEQGPGVN